MATTLRGCLVVLGSVLIHLTLGTLYTFGNISPYMTSYIRKKSRPSDLSYAESVWIFALAMLGLGTTMFFGGLLEKRLGPRVTVLCGAWFQSLGVALTYFSIQHSFAATAVTYGLMFGFGVGVAYAVPISVVMRWFPNKKGLVSGCVVAGFGGGPFIFDQIQTAYINPDNKSADLTIGDVKYFTQDDILNKVPQTFLILGGSYAVIQLLGCLLLANPPVAEEDMKVIPPPEINAEATEIRASVVVPELAVTPKALFKEREFYVLWFVFLLNGQGVTVISSLYKAYGESFIADDVFLAWTGAMAAVCNAGGRVLWGCMADRFSVKVTLLCLCCMTTALLLTLVATSLVGKWMFLVWVCLLFLAFAGSFSLLPIACVRAFGQPHYTKNFGLIYTAMIFIGPVFAVLTSQLKSVIGWNGMFFLVAAFSFISFILVAVAFKKKMPDGSDVYWVPITSKSARKPSRKSSNVSGIFF